MNVHVRIAPSPTGFLHIGVARTALFNYLFARANGGKFLIRVEDTDAGRNSQESVDSIFDGLNWLGLNPDEEPVYQSKNIDAHKQAAHQLLESGHAYKCFTPAEELAELREAAQAKGERFMFQSPWRDADPATHPDAPYVVRFKTPREGSLSLRDHVQGEVTIPADSLDDLILLRSDGTPTYMLAVVVDDAAMKITHVIRGDDHLTNSFKQKLLFEALGHDVPNMAHIPLIHGPDGAKLSKRHGALGIDAYRQMGYLPEGLRNYLLRLGWSHGDDEIISDGQAQEWFDLEHISKSPARIDFDKMASVNAHYLRALATDDLFALLLPFLKTAPEGQSKDALFALLPALKERAQTLVELAEQSAFVFARVPYTEKAAAMLDDAGRAVIADLLPKLEALADWKGEAIKQVAYDYAEANGTKLGKVLPAIRSGVCGTMEAPDLMLVLEALGKEECLKRLSNL